MATCPTTSARRMRWRAVEPPSSFSDETRSRRVALHAGARPKKTQANVESPIA